VGEVKTVRHEVVGIERVRAHELRRGVMYRICLNASHLWADKGGGGREGGREGEQLRGKACRFENAGETSFPPFLPPSPLRRDVL